MDPTKEILTWGAETPAQFERLGITPRLTYQGKRLIPSVYALTDEQFSVLDADPEENWEDKDAGWRWAKGSNLYYCPIKRVNVNHRYMDGFVPKGMDCGPYCNLLAYLSSTLSVSQPQNVTAVTADLAQFNRLTLGDLFARYQPVE